MRAGRLPYPAGRLRAAGGRNHPPGKREARDFDPEIDVAPAISLLTALIGWTIIIPRFVSICLTGERIAKMQSAAGLECRVQPDSNPLQCDHRPAPYVRLPSRNAVLPERTEQDLGSLQEPAGGKPAAACHTRRLPNYRCRLTRSTLISSLIHLRPESFGVHHVGQAAEVTDPPDLRQTRARRLGKRVGSLFNATPVSMCASSAAFHSSQGRLFSRQILPVKDKHRSSRPRCCCRCRSQMEAGNMPRRR